MKLLLTSGGITNPSIHSALVQLLGKPIAESHALVVPTAQWGHPLCGPASMAPLGARGRRAPDDRTPGVVDFSIFPHLDVFPTNTMTHAERWAADIGAPAYAIDDQTAIKAAAGFVEVISEGTWTSFGS